MSYSDIIINVTNSLSILAILTFFFVYSKTTGKKPGYLSCVFQLIVADLIYAFANILTNFNEDSNFICVAEGFARELGLLLSVFWATCLGFISFKSTQSEAEKTDTYYKWMKTFGYGICIVISTIPLLDIDDFRYMKNVRICWIPELNDIVWPQVVMLYGFAWAAIFLTSFWCMKTYFFISDLGIPELKSSRRLLIYPLILVLVFLPSTINLIIKESNDLYITIHSLTETMIGFYNVLAYNLNRISTTIKNPSLYVSLSENPQTNESEHKESEQGMGAQRIPSSFAEAMTLSDSLKGAFQQMYNPKKS